MGTVMVTLLRSVDLHPWNRALKRGTFCAAEYFPRFWKRFCVPGRASNSMTTFFEHQKSSFKRNYLKNLIVLASADGALGEDERSLITKIGLRRGLKAWQIDELFSDIRDHQTFLPESMANRMNMLYDLMELVYVDRQANANEIRYIRNLLEVVSTEAGTNG